MESNDCFIEYLYGTHSAQTNLFKCLRDSLLKQSKEGQEIVRLYNQYNALLISVIEEDPDFKNQVKDILDQLIPIIRMLFGKSKIKKYY